MTSCIITAVVQSWFYLPLSLQTWGWAATVLWQAMYTMFKIVWFEGCTFTCIIISHLKIESVNFISKWFFLEVPPVWHATIYCLTLLCEVFVWFSRPFNQMMLSCLLDGQDSFMWIGVTIVFTLCYTGTQLGNTDESSHGGIRLDRCPSVPMKAGLTIALISMSIACKFQILNQ